jgi:hypothetical protein
MDMHFVRAWKEEEKGRIHFLFILYIHISPRVCLTFGYLPRNDLWTTRLENSWKEAPENGQYFNILVPNNLSQWEEVSCWKKLKLKKKLTLLKNSYSAICYTVELYSHSLHQETLILYLFLSKNPSSSNLREIMKNKQKPSKTSYSYLPQFWSKDKKNYFLIFQIMRRSMPWREEEWKIFRDSQILLLFSFLTKAFSFHSISMLGTTNYNAMHCSLKLKTI